MGYFTLRIFHPLQPNRVSGLALVGETRIDADTAEDGKRILTEWIDRRALERERFYRFDGFAPFRGGRSQFVLDISFYLFEDGRLCPVRIWHRSEQASNQTGESDWMADFNGIPGWSLVASVEPRWHHAPGLASANSWIGRSHRDWYKRACWTLTPQAHQRKSLEPPLKLAS